MVLFSSRKEKEIYVCQPTFLRMFASLRLLTQRNAGGEEKNKGKMDMAVYIFTSAFSLNNIFKTPLPTSTNIHQHVNQDCSLQQVK